MRNKLNLTASISIDPECVVVVARIENMGRKLDIDRGSLSSSPALGISSGSGGSVVKRITHEGLAAAAATARDSFESHGALQKPNPYDGEASEAGMKDHQGLVRSDDQKADKLTLSNSSEITSFGMLRGAAVGKI